MQAKSFIDILANELRKEIRAEVEAELSIARAGNVFGPAARIESSHKAESVELWLNLRMGGAVASGNFGARASAYQQSARQQPARSADHQPTAIRQLPSARKTEVKAERKGTATTIEQTIALEFFGREGSALAATFTETELKSEFRKIALRIHPDRHTSASGEQLKSLSTRFQTLVESAEILEAALN